MARIPKSAKRVLRKSRPEAIGAHYVYAEGEKTEPYYVDNIKRRIEQKHFSPNEIVIEIVPHDGFNTKGLVVFAEEDIARKIKEGTTVDHVWIFYDRDSFPKDNFDNAYHKIISKNKDKYIDRNRDGDPCDENGVCWHSIWSNECFEIWVILHFELLNSALIRNEYKKMIDRFLGKGVYKKNMDDLYDVLVEKGSVSKAVGLAKKLIGSNHINNPSTNVQEFVEFFKLYLEYDV